MNLMLTGLRLLAVTCFLTLNGCSRADPKATVQVDEVVSHLASARLNSEADVQRVVSNAIASERAILFIHVDWAPMEPQRTNFARFMIEYSRLHPDDGLGFHYVDCTSIGGNYLPLKSIPGWAELQDAAGMSLIHGEGELVWMEHGHALHVERIGGFDSVARLMQKTETLMPLRNRGKQ